MSKSQPTKPEENSADVQAFLREVDENLHYEKMQSLWEQWRFVVFGGIAALFLFVGGSGLWSMYRTDKLEGQAEKYFVMAGQAELDKVQGDLTSLQKNGSEGFELLTTFRLAYLLAEAGDNEAAIAEYEKIAKGSYEEAYKSLALFYQARLMARTDKEAAIALLQTLAQPKAIYQYSAMEAMALLYEQTNRASEAVAIYEKLAATQTLAPNFRQRVTVRLNALQSRLGS